MKKIDSSFLIYASEVIADTKNGLTGSNIVKYCNSYSIDFGVAIPITSSNFGDFGSVVPNKRTALLKNLEMFEASQQFKIIKELCELEIFKDNIEVQKLKRHLLTRYGHFSQEKIEDSVLIQETKHWLSKYTDVLKEYELGLSKYESGIYERNTLDDMRLAFELLVKTLLVNNKSLENQMSEIGIILKEKGASVEIRNMMVKLIQYYTDFQNAHVKHNNIIDKNEIEFIIEQTSILMKYLIKILETD